MDGHGPRRRPSAVRPRRRTGEDARGPRLHRGGRARGVYQGHDAACDSAAALTVAGLKGKERAAAKASDEYKDKTAPFVSWLFDVVRASVVV